MIVGSDAAEVPGVGVEHEDGSTDAESARLSDVLGDAWHAWEHGDAEGLLAAIARARALGGADAETLTWMDEAETAAREQADNARYHRARTEFERGNVEDGLRAWLGLSASAKAAIRASVNAPEFAWLDALDAHRLDAVFALRLARSALEQGEPARASAVLEPHAALLALLPVGRDALSRARGSAATAVPKAQEDEPTALAPAPAVPTPPAATASSIAALASHIAGGGTFRVQAPASDWPLVLALALRDLLPGDAVDSDLDHIHAAIGRRDSWRGLPADLAVRLVELVAARLRALQASGIQDRRIDLAFSAVSAWSKKEKPGFAHGLMRDHGPRTGAWEDDADAAIDDLYDALPVEEPTPKRRRGFTSLEALVAEHATCPPDVRDAVCAQIRTEVCGLLADGVSARDRRLARLVAPVADVLTSPELRAVRRAARLVAHEDSDEPGDAEDGEIADDWKGWEATRGKRAVMVGGDPREPNRVRLQRSFGFEELAWERAEFSRNSLQKVRDRVRAGGVDLVLILTRFVGHDADQVILPACRDAGVPFVPVKSGYGVTGIRLAIERYVQPRGHEIESVPAR